MEQLLPNSFAYEMESERLVWIVVDPWLKIISQGQSYCTDPSILLKTLDLITREINKLGEGSYCTVVVRKTFDVGDSEVAYYIPLRESVGDEFLGVYEKARSFQIVNGIENAFFKKRNLNDNTSE